MVNLIVEIIYPFATSLIIILALFGKIDKSLSVLVFFLPLQNVLNRFYTYPFGKDFIHIAFLALTIGWLIRCISKGEKLFEKNQFGVILFFMTLYTFISFLHGSMYLHLPLGLDSHDVRFQTWKNSILFIVLFLIAMNNIKNVKQMKFIFFVMVVSTLIASYYTIKQTSSFSSLISRDKITGTFVWLGPNEVAAFFANYSFIFLGVLMFIKNRMLKLILVGVLCACLYCVVFLYSRGAYVAVFSALLFVSVMKNKKLLIVLILMFICWQTILPQKVVERITQTKTEYGNLDQSSQTRLDLWNLSIDLFKSNPAMGIGFNVFPFLGYSLGDTHNLYMKILAEQGIIGFSIFAVFFFLVFKRGWKLYRDSKDAFLKGLGFGFVACSTCMLVINIFGDRFTYLPLGAYFWIFLAMVERGILLNKTPRLQPGKRN